MSDANERGLDGCGHIFLFAFFPLCRSLIVGPCIAEACRNSQMSPRRPLAQPRTWRLFDALRNRYSGEANYTTCLLVILCAANIVSVAQAFAFEQWGDAGVGFGIAGLVLAIGAMLAPIGFNLVTLWIALACATLAMASTRGPLFAAGIWLASASAILIMSPQTLAALFGELPNTDPAAAQVGTASLYVTLAAFAAPVLALLARVRVTQARGDDNTLPALEIASAPAPSEELQVEPAPAPREATVPAPRIRSASARVLLFAGLALGAAAVVVFLRDMDRATSGEQAQPTSETTVRRAM